MSEGPDPSPRQSPLAKNRAVSGASRLVDVSEGTSGSDDQVHPASILGRRRSLPAFHPDNQQYAQRPSHLSTLPTIPDFAASQCESDPTLQSFPSSGHGGAYRSGSANPKYGAAPYPLRGPMSYNYRSGSMPGTGVFRVPTNPNGTLSSNRPWVNGGNDEGGYDNKFLGPGMLNANGFTFNNPQPPEEEPFAFPPRRLIPDQVNPGPLPRADFSFGDNNANPTSSPAYQDDDTTDNEASRVARMAQSHRFGSFASDYSIESDATGTTNTTTTSSVFSPMSNPPFSGSGGAGYRVARFGLMQGLGIHPHTYDSETGPPISYGTGGGGPMSGSLSAGPVHFPIGFQPDMRRASWYVHLHLCL